MNKKLIGMFICILVISSALSTTIISASSVIDQQQTSYDTYLAIFNHEGGRSYWAQSFKPSKNMLDKVEIYIGKLDNPLMPLEFYIRSNINGGNLATVTKIPAQIPTQATWIDFDFPDISVTVDYTYYIVFETDYFPISGKVYLWGAKEYGNPYSRGSMWYKWNSNPWSPNSNPDTDACFITYGYNANQPPNTPSNPSPSNGATGVSINADLSWTGGDPDGDTVYYDVYFEANDPTPDQLVSSGQTSTTYDPETMNYDTHYYWKIIAEDEHGATTTGPIWDFETEDAPNQPPYTPSNPNPVDGATGVSTNADLSWTCSDPDGDSLTYDVYFGTSSYPPLVSSGQTSTTYNPGTMNSLTTYYWKIKAKDEHGEKTTGPIWDFTTKNNPPNPPSNPSPPDGATGVNVNADLSWTCSDPDGDSLTYDVYFEAWDSTPDEKVSSGQTSTTYDPPGNMDYYTTYYWKIVAKDEHGDTTTGPVWDFTTEIEQIDPPSVTTNDASVGSLFANLYGTLDDVGGQSSCQVWFVYDDESHNNWLEYSDDTDPQTMYSTGSFNSQIPIIEGKTYYFRAIASNSGGTVQGTEKEFQSPTVSLDPDFLDFGEMLKEQTKTLAFEIWNSGEGALYYSFSTDTDWITDINPASGVSYGEHDEISITIDTTGLTLGQKTGNFQLDTTIYFPTYDYPVYVKIVYNFAPPNATLNISDIDYCRLDANPFINLPLGLIPWPTLPNDMSSASYGYYGHEANTETGFERAAVKARYASVIKYLPGAANSEAHLRATYTVPVTTAPGIPHHAEVSLAGNCKGWVWIETLGGSNANVDIIIREGTSKTYPDDKWAVGFKNLKKYEVGTFLGQEDKKFNYDFTHYKDKVRVCLDEGKTYSFWVSVKANLLLWGFELVGWECYGQGWSDIQFQFDSIQIKYRNPPISPPEGENLPEITNHYGPKNLILGEQGSFTARANDTDGDQLYYKWYWGDGTETEWLGPYESDQTVDKEHTYETPGNYFVRTQTKENTEFELLSNITEPLEVFVFRPEGEIIVDKPAAGDKVQYVQREPILFPIEWQKSGFTGDKVDIALYKGNGNGNYEFIRHIFKNFPNDGSCNWKPQPSDGYGNDFRVVIYNGINAANASGRFTILKPRSKIREIFLEKIISLIREMPLFQKLIDIVTRINNILETK